MTSDKTSPWVDNIRALFRPGLTVYLWLFVGVMVVTFRAYFTGETIVERVIDPAIFAASTATVWWFGDRALRAPARKP